MRWGLLLSAVILGWPRAAGAASFVQDDWQAGAAPGSTTSARSGWNAYESQDGAVVVQSTGIQSTHDVTDTWSQTDDGSADTGFNRTGRILSSAAVSGSGIDAQVRLSTSELVSVSTTPLPEARGGISAAYHPASGWTFLFGGIGPDGSASKSILKYDGISNTLLDTGKTLFSERGDTGAAYHPGLDRMFIFGGSSGTTYSLQILECDPSDADTWPVTPLPAPRSRVSVVYHPGTQRIYAFGGESSDPPFFDEIVEYDPPPSDAAVVMSTRLPTGRSSSAAAYHPGTGLIYLFGGTSASGELAEIVAYDPVQDSRTVMGAALPSPRSGMTAAYHPETGKIYLYGGSTDGLGPTDQVLEFDAVADTVIARPVPLPTARGGMAAVYDTMRSGVFLFGASTGTPADFDEILSHLMVTSGTYVSSVFDIGNIGILGALSYHPASQFSPSVELTVGFRAGPTPTPDDSWTPAGQGFVFVPNGGTLSYLNSPPNRYVQYVATFTTTELSTSAVLDDISMTYSHTAASATLISNAVDTLSDYNMFRQIRWQGSFPSGTTVQFQLRTAPDSGGYPGAWSDWLGPTSAADYYTSSSGADPVHPSHGDAADDRWFQYRARLLSSLTLNAPAVSTVTVSFDFKPDPPVLLPMTPDSTTQITLEWTDGSTNEDGFWISTGTTPNPAGADRFAPTTDQAGSGGGYSIVLTGLSPNTPYFARARSYISPPIGLYSDFSNERNTFTFANPPVSLAVSEVHLSSLTLAWGRNSNPLNTPYEISVSTDDFVAHFSTPVPFASGLIADSTTLYGLAPGTTYTLRVRAQNGNTVPTDFGSPVSTATTPEPLAGLSVSATGISSVSWSWAASGPAARYRIYDAATTGFLSDTALTSFDKTGLSTNTAHGIRVQPYTSSEAGSLSPPVTGYTLAAAPAWFPAQAVSSTTIGLAWDAAGNPGTTPYELSLSTDGFAAHFSTPIAFSQAYYALTATASALQAGTTYQLRVRARNGDSVVTEFSAILTTPTLPGTVAGLSTATVGVSSLAWAWVGTAGPAVSAYELRRASDGALIALTSGTAFVETGLSTNSIYGLRVRALDAAGAGALSPAATSYTLAASPAGTTLSEVHPSSATLRWDARGNPAYTRYELWHATGTTPSAPLLTVTTDNYTGTGLKGGATHYFRVRAFNEDGLATGFDVEVSTFVTGSPPMPPSAFRAVPAGGARILLEWTVSPTTTVVQYNMYYDAGSGAIDYGVTYTTVPGGTTSYLTAPLAAGVTYWFGLRSQDELEQEETNRDVTAMAAAIVAFAGPSAAVSTPPPNRRLGGDRLTVSARLLYGTPEEVSEVLFQYKAAAAAAWTDLPPLEERHPNPAAHQPFSTFWDASLLPDGLYHLRAVAKGLSGNADPNPSVVQVELLAADPDISETLLAPGRARKSVRVYDGAPTELEMTDILSDVVTRIGLATAAITVETTFLDVENDPLGIPSVPRDYADPSIMRSISLRSGALCPGKTLSMRFSHLDRDGDNRVDGTGVRADNLAIFAYSASSQAWRKDFASSVEPDEELSVSAATPHLSLFAVFSPASEDLNAVRVYPIPYKPNGTDPNEGKPYSPGDQTSGLIFDGLTQRASVRIYTVTGSLVWESAPENTGGLIRWDARNGDRNDVASGVYFAVISSEGMKPLVRKIVVLR
ncbi:MAG: hypothetical protein WC728_06710 [Elusimicrobiota bacterium]